MGDPAGIGAEIIVKALQNKRLYLTAIPLVIGNTDFIKLAMNYSSINNLNINKIKNFNFIKGQYGTIDVLDVRGVDLKKVEYGKVSKQAGQASLDYIFKAIDLAKADKIAAIVTAPIHKEAINATGKSYTGHTEILAAKTNTKDFAMMLVDNNLRVIHVSTHVALRKACDLVKKARVLKVIELADQALHKMGILNPRIAVAGLNPHAGEQGLFGEEEIKEIIPAINAAAERNINVVGPISPDTIFSKVKGGQYDIAVVMYHDQGHIPMKISGFVFDQEKNKWNSVSGVNVTVGLPIIRTSVDHGTAFEIAGQGKANPESMIQAFELAVDFIK